MRKFKFSQKTVLRLMTIAAVVVALGTLIVQGLQLPWSEEGALFALYGFGVGFSVAILCNIALLWLFARRRRR